MMMFQPIMETEKRSPILSKITLTPSSGVLLRPMIRRLTV